MTMIPEDRRFEIPPAAIEDRVAIVAAQTCSMAEESHRKIQEIEKLALYYILTNSRLEKARQLREIVAAALSRIPIDQERMRYDHLFDKADREKQQMFWTEHIAAVEVLANTYVKLSNAYEAGVCLKTTA